MTSNNPLDRILLQLSPTDSWDARAACEGTLILGSPGSGKSSTAARELRDSFLRAGYGGVVYIAKPEETHIWIDHAKATGRESDLIVFNAASGHSYDPLKYVWSRPGRSSADIEAVVDFIATLVAVGKTHAEGSSDRFWDLACQQAIRAAVVLLSLANAPVSIATINDVIDSLPSHGGAYDSVEWQRSSYAASLIEDIRKRYDKLSTAQISDLELVVRFMLRWEAMDERPRSSIHATWSGISDRFTYQPLQRLFAGGNCTFIPEQTTQAGKIVLVDFPVLEYGLETARLVACLIKLSFQRAWLQRDITQYPEVVFQWADEAQLFILPKNRDNTFQAVARGLRIATVQISQSIDGIAEEIGETVPGSKTKAWIGNLATNIFLRSISTDTIRYAADLIGKEWSTVGNVGYGGQNANVGAQDAQRYRVEPDDFTRLTKPDGDNPIATAYVYQGGRLFNHTKSSRYPNGRNFILASFSR